MFSLLIYHWLLFVMLNIVYFVASIFLYFFFPVHSLKRSCYFYILLILSHYLSPRLSFFFSFQKRSVVACRWYIMSVMLKLQLSTRLQFLLVNRCVLFHVIPHTFFYFSHSLFCRFAQNFFNSFLNFYNFFFASASSLRLLVFFILNALHFLRQHKKKKREANHESSCNVTKSHSECSIGRADRYLKSSM